MADYRIDMRDIKFVLNEQLGWERICGLAKYAEAGADPDMLNDMVDQAFKMAKEVLAPINTDSDRDGCKIENGQVIVPDYYRNVYKMYCENGWGSITSDPTYGGMGMPELLNTAGGEIFTGACTSFTMMPGLTKAAANVISTFGTDEQKAVYLEKMISGQWAGTMCLTEPVAGSDVGASKCMAVPIEGRPGWYKVSGVKSFITFGDNDITENVIHLVLARTPGAPPGIKGIGLFIVPKFRIGADGSVGERNDMDCGGIEHKMGIHGSPTCTLNFGENDKCEGELIGDVYSGIKYMFLMMNEERLMVGMQGLALAAYSYQAALQFAQERVQGSDIKNFKDPDAPKVAIINHADVRRMLLTCKAYTEGMRALLYTTAYYIDLAHNLEAGKEKDKYLGFIEILTPICKAYCSDTSFKVTEHAVQVHGGYGFCCEYPVEQCMRDVKITSIYEGTNGIQALDLLGRKMAMKGGSIFMGFVMSLNDRVAALKKNPATKELGELVEAAKGKFNTVAIKFMGLGREKSIKALVPIINACDFLEMFGDVLMGIMLSEQAAIAAAKLDAIYADKGAADDKAKAAVVKDSSEAKFYFGKVASATFFVKNLLPRVLWKEAAIMKMDTTVLENVFPEVG